MGLSRLQSTGSQLLTTEASASRLALSQARPSGRRTDSSFQKGCFGLPSGEPTQTDRDYWGVLGAIRGLLGIAGACLGRLPLGRLLVHVGSLLEQGLELPKLGSSHKPPIPLHKP